ncbi:hypothetical protein GCM10027162_05550 [Streptomyces incanus]
MSITGPRGEPTKLRVPISDLLIGMNGALGILAALFERARTVGPGQCARACRPASSASTPTRHSLHRGRADPGRRGQSPSVDCALRLFESGDSPLQIACGNDSLWRRLCEVVGIDAQDHHFVTNCDRVTHRAQIIKLLNAQAS